MLTPASDINMVLYMANGLHMKFNYLSHSKHQTFCGLMKYISRTFLLTSTQVD